MKKINRKSVTNFLSYKEMMNVTGGRGGGAGPCPYSYDGCYDPLHIVIIPWNCNDNEDCINVVGNNNGYCLTCKNWG